MAYEDYCASCTYLGDNYEYNGKYFCDRKGERVLACDPKCYRYCEAYSRSNSARENMYGISKDHSSSGCYLTTAMCYILGYPDNNYYLETLRNFRDETLKKNTKYFPILLTYDVIGPQIVKNLLVDPNKEVIAKRLFSEYITKAVTAIENNKIEEAINIYVAMTHTLASRYSIESNIIYIDPKTITKYPNDIENLGHARTKKKID